MAEHNGMLKKPRQQQGQIRVKLSRIVFLSMFLLIQPCDTLADYTNGKNLYVQRCAVCHGADVKGTGVLANKSNPPTPDLTTTTFKKRLNDYPGVIVSSIILRPNGNLIPKTLQENGVKIPPHAWSIKDLRDLNQYMTRVISTTQGGSGRGGFLN